MPAWRASDGSLRRATLAIHLRLQAETEARKAGLQIIAWRGGKPVVRLPMRKPK